MEKSGIDYLRKKLNHHKLRVDARYRYYAMQYFDPSLGITIPPDLYRRFRAILGWTSKSVDSLANRLVFREFTNDDFLVNDIFKLNNPDIFFDSAVLSALIGSCCFVYISPDENGQPRLQVIEANNATGVIDPTTGLLTEGYAVLERDEHDQPLIEAYFLPETTIYLDRRLDEPYEIENPTGHPLLVPVIHLSDSKRPFGRSRITRAGIYWQQYAQRAMVRSEITAEFYSFPQKYVVGTSQEADALDTWRATISSMLEFTKDEDGDVPKLGQFTTSTMTPFIDQLKMAAAGFAGETGLTMDDLGFVSDNPSSVEAIRASHENLRLAGRKAQRSLGAGLLNVAYLSACLRDGVQYRRTQFVNTQPKWEPLFEADANTLTLIGDGAIKLNQAIPGYINGETIRDLTGIKGAELDG